MLNQVQLIGNVGKDPEVRSTQGGDKIANFSLATSEKWKDRNSGERKEATEWHRVTVFGPLVEIVESYVVKGSKLYVCGKVKTRKWTDNKGAERYSTEIVLSGPEAKMLMLGEKQGVTNQDEDEDAPRERSNGRAAGKPAERKPAARKAAPISDDDLDDEIPF